jgi:transcription antitermination factor NusG
LRWARQLLVAVKTLNPDAPRHFYDTNQARLEVGAKVTVVSGQYSGERGTIVNPIDEVRPSCDVELTSLTRRIPRRL